MISIRQGAIWSSLVFAGASSLGLLSADAPTAAVRDAGHDNGILVDGLRIWRKPGSIDGGAACATCHSPDGIELAAYDFDDADLLRRARRHLDDEDSQAIVDYVHALRTKLGFVHLRDPFNDRPLQPGGRLLPGKTPAERDYAFGLELKQKLPLLFGRPIHTIQGALAAQDQLLGLQPVNLPIGIPFNRLSEDYAHGKEHASIAQWLPEVPPTIPENERDEWYAAEDRYLAEPTMDRLQDLLNRHRELVHSATMPGLSGLSVFKFRALLVWQDRIRHQTEQKPTNVASDVASSLRINQIWEVGEFVRQLIGRDAKSIGMDPDIQREKLIGPALSDQLHSLRSSWFWAGWLSDQGLFKTSREDRTRFGMWLSESLSADGPYPIHNVYSNARRQAVICNDPIAWGETEDRKRIVWDFAGLRSFGYQWRDMPTSKPYRDLYVQFTANCFRMNLLLLENDIIKHNLVWTKISTRENIAELVRFLDKEDPSDAASADRMKVHLLALVDRARERFNYRNTIGGHP
ncbi:MAG: hypothetical protein P4L46_05540 [Fimbriimonas sp.]|nr:hypothetical protein [Fimbriimonas sp.]